MMTHLARAEWRGAARLEPLEEPGAFERLLAVVVGAERPRLVPVVHHRRRRAPGMPRVTGLALHLGEEASTRSRREHDVEHDRDRPDLLEHAARLAPWWTQGSTWNGVPFRYFS